MLRKPLQKIKNPQIGIYSVRFRDNKGAFTGKLSSASSFQYVTKSGSLSRKVSIPSEIKKASDKKLFIYAVLGKIINANEKRKETTARKKSKEYIKKRAEEFLQVPYNEISSLRTKYPEVFKESEEVYLDLVTDDELQQRIIRAKKIRKTIGDGLFSSSLKVKTDGPRTPQLLGDVANWVDIQKSVGFIRDTIVYEERTRKNKRTGKTTHYKVKKKTYMGDGSIMFFFTRKVREWLINNRKALQDKTDKTTLNTGLRIGLVTDIVEHKDFMYSNQIFMIPKNLGPKAYKKRVEGIVWGMAKECFRLLNDDFESADEPKNGLTSSEIYTKVRFINELEQNFTMFFIIMSAPVKQIPKFLQVDARSGYLRKSRKNKAFYEKGE